LLSLTALPGLPENCTALKGTFNFRSCKTHVHLVSLSFLLPLYTLSQIVLGTSDNPKEEMRLETNRRLLFLSNHFLTPFNPDESGF